MSQGQLFGLPDTVATSIDGTAKDRTKAKREYRQSTPEELAKMEADAIAAGTHSPISEWRTVCSGCRQWVSHVYHANPQNTREHFCINCCPVDTREMVLAAQAKRADNAAAMDDFSGENVGAAEAPLPEGVSRAEDIGLPPS